jgi:hypothetical protein
VAADTTQSLKEAAAAVAPQHDARAPDDKPLQRARTTTSNNNSAGRSSPAFALVNYGSRVVEDDVAASAGGSGGTPGGALDRSAVGCGTPGGVSDCSAVCCGAGALDGTSGGASGGRWSPRFFNMQSSCGTPPAAHAWRLALLAVVLPSLMCSTEVSYLTATVLRVTHLVAVRRAVLLSAWLLLESEMSEDPPGNPNPNPNPNRRWVVLCSSSSILVLAGRTSTCLEARGSREDGDQVHSVEAGRGRCRRCLSPPRVSPGLGTAS